ncbi:MAG: hypothetical protein ABSF29_16265 [Tepidisphaeraceae bacterium]|jgi:hypothetical protein
MNSPKPSLPPKKANGWPSVGKNYKPLLIALLLAPVGCASEPEGIDISNASPAHASATNIPVEQATPAYWLTRPAKASAVAFDFPKLCDACLDVARDYQFTIDRTDYRQGVITTTPKISPQLFEFWRKDAGTYYDELQSSLQTIRRTIRFELSRSDEGLFTVRPKVLVEKLSIEQRRITSETQYQFVFSPLGNSGTFTTDQGVTLPLRYWYAIGRDEPMEKQLAEAIARKLR